MKRVGRNLFADDRTKTSGQFCAFYLILQIPRLPPHPPTQRFALEGRGQAVFVFGAGRGGWIFTESTYFRGIRLKFCGIATTPPPTTTSASRKGKGPTFSPPPQIQPVCGVWVVGVWVEGRKHWEFRSLLGLAASLSAWMAQIQVTGSSSFRWKNALNMYNKLEFICGEKLFLYIARID